MKTVSFSFDVCVRESSPYVDYVLLLLSDVFTMLLFFIICFFTFRVDAFAPPFADIPICYCHCISFSNVNFTGRLRLEVVQNLSLHMAHGVCLPTPPCPTVILRVSHERRQRTSTWRRHALTHTSTHRRMHRRTTKRSSYWRRKTERLQKTAKISSRFQLDSGFFGCEQFTLYQPLVAPLLRPLKHHKHRFSDIALCGHRRQLHSYDNRHLPL